MATPIAPVASAAPAAPAASPAASAPVSTSTPTTTPTSTPATSTPVTPTTPVETPAAVTPAVETQPVAVEKPAPPKQSDYAGDLEGYLKAKFAYEREHGEIPKEEPKPAEAVPADTVTKEQEGAKTAAAEEVAPAENPADEPQAADITPEALSSWMEKSEKLREAFEADPELKGAMFQMARLNAKLAPIGEIFPSVESAKFANDTANTFVGLRTSFLQTIENPESIGEVYGKLAEQFMERDEKGNPVLDEQGDPVLGEDFHNLNDFIVGSYFDLEMEQLGQQIESGKFATDKAKEEASLVLEAMKFIKAYRENGLDELDKPDTSQMTPEAKAYFEQKERELESERERLGLKTKEQSAEAKKQAREQYRAAVWSKVGAETSNLIRQIITEKSANGVYIPSYVLEVKDSAGTPVFAMKCFNKFKAKLSGSSAINNELARLEMLPPSAENEARYANYVNGLVREYLPAIVDAEQKEITRKSIHEIQAQAVPIEKRQQHASVEPRGGTTTKPAQMTPELAMKQAKEWVAQNYPNLNSNERLAKELAKKNEILGRNYV